MNVVSRSLSHYFSGCFYFFLSLSLGSILFLSVIIPIIGLSVCLIIVHLIRLFIFPFPCNSLLTLKGRNRISVSFSFYLKNSNGKATSCANINKN